MIHKIDNPLIDKVKDGYYDTKITLPVYEGQEGAVGMKYDNGKLMASIPLDDFPRAIKAVARISTYGAKKYARSSWVTVPDAKTRYRDAMVRHQLEMSVHGLRSRDTESNLMHLAHFAWNALAILELELREMELNNDETDEYKIT